MYGVCALGDRGGDQVVEIIQTQLRQVLEQLGCETIAELPQRLA
jgi:L-lactate dehydrogenase (cytochrome)